MRKRIIVRAPVLSRSGYGEHARFLLRALRSQEENFDTYLLNIPWGLTGWIFKDDEERNWLDSLIKKTVFYMQQGGQFDISLQVTIPNEWEKMAPINIGCTAGAETTKIAPEWIQKANMMDKIIVVSSHAKHGFENTSYEAKNEQTGEIVKDFKCTTPVEVVNYPVRAFEADENFNLELEYDFNFITMCQWSARKNLENTIKWWIEEFVDQEVGLIVKTSIRNDSIIDRTYTLQKINALLKEYKNRKCKIYLLHGNMDEKELSALFQHPKVKALINLSHGEGFGLPEFEATYYGLPVIASDWGGHCDFLYRPKENKRGKIKNKGHFAKVDYDIAPIQDFAVWEGVLIKDSMWCFPKPSSYKKQIREVYKNYDRFKKQAVSLQEWVTNKFEAEKKYKEFCDHLAEYIEDDDEWLSNIESIIEEYE